MGGPTLFTFGYWGWGNSTRRLVQMVDAVEERRGHEPPLFVDLRIRRTVRAPGFRDDSFSGVVGKQRYLWMNDLGNAAILDRGPMRLKNPKAALDLLDLARSRARKDQRILAFCACESPRSDGRISCHRVMVADKVLSYARRDGQHITIVEWPGADPAGIHIELRYPGPEYARILRGAKWIPIGGQLTLASAGSLPWYLPVKIMNKDDPQSSIRVLSGPARYVGGEWIVPVLELVDPDSSGKQLEALVHRRTKGRGCLERSV